jgi:formylglycine-generating enzyme required for sulfatase activity
MENITKQIKTYYYHESPVEELYSENVIIKPDGFFRRAVIEKQTKTRTVMKRTRLHIDVLIGSETREFDFCLIPSGSFTMGDELNGPIHQVTISNEFYLGKYPVTRAQWDYMSGYYGKDMPVVKPSWLSCQNYVRWLNSMTQEFSFRLPTEAEWEYACRAGSTGNFCCEDSEILEYGWFAKNSSLTPQPVGRKKPNAWGLYDMHGNVTEWCNDWYGRYPDGAAIDPQGPPSGDHRILRGGSSFDNTNFAISAKRHTYEPKSGTGCSGLRLVVIPNHTVQHLDKSKIRPLPDLPQRQGWGEGWSEGI